MNYYDAASAPPPAPHGGQPAPAPGPHANAGAGVPPPVAAPHGHNPFAMMHHPHGHPHGHPHPHAHHPYGPPPHHHPHHPAGMPPPMMMYHHPHPMMGMPPPPPPPATSAAPTAASSSSSRGPTPTPPVVPSHLPPGVRVPTPRAVSLETQEFAAAAKEDDGTAETNTATAAEDSTSTTQPPSLLSSAPPSRPESVEPGVAQLQPQLQPEPTAGAGAAAPTAAPAQAPIAGAALDAMMLAAATVAAGTASGAASGTANGAAGMGLSPKSSKGNRLPAEEVASFLMTLKHRSVSPDLVDDTASCLASMKMPHLMPTASMDAGDSANANGGGAASGGTGGSVNLGPGSVQTTEGQVLKFRETARPLGLPMATPEDRFWLSDVSCFVRAHCCEFFVAEGQEDNLTKTRSKSGKEFTTTAGRRSKVTAGRVGIRCVFCRDGLNKVVQSTSFPNKIANIYSAIIMMQCRHFPLCPFMPADVRSRLEAIKNGAPMAMPPMSIADSAGAATGTTEEDDGAASAVNVEGTNGDDNEEDADKSKETDAEIESIGNDDDAGAASSNSSDATVDITSTAPTVPASASSNTPGRQIYWSNSARKLGLIDTESDGIRFAPGVDFTAMVEKAQAEKIEAARKIREAVAAAAASESSAAAMAAGIPPTSNHFMPLDVNVAPSGSFDSQSDGHSISSATLVSRSSASAASASTSGKGRKKKGGASKADGFTMPSPGTIEKFDVPDMSDEATVRKLMGATDLVEVGDKDLIPSYIFLAFAQLKRCALTEPDRVGCYKDRELGFTGMCCKHCGGAPGFGKYFPGTVRSLAQTTTSQTILKHVGSKCRMTPPHIRQAIMVLQAQEDSEKAAYARGPENDGRPRYGSRKVFFARLFNTLHGLPVPPLPTPEEQEAASKPKPAKKATTKRRSSSTSSTSSKSNKKQKTSPNLLPSLPPLGAVVSEDSADMPPIASVGAVGGDSDEENKA